MNLNIMRPQFGEPDTLIYLGTGLEFARIGGPNNFKNAVSIVQACNMHNDFVNALRVAQQALRKALPHLSSDLNNVSSGVDVFCGECLDEINELLTKLESQP